MDISDSQRMRAMTFLMNTWYVAAWGHEITDELFSRTLLNEKVLIYRRLDGVAVAISDRCPHRFAPLSLGRLKGDNVQCGYHGLEFDGTGACVGNPHGKVIPKACRVRSFPLVERYGILWIWPGDAALADENVIPDFGHLVEPGHKTVHGGTVVNANYELIADNLMDASHTQYVHLDLLGTEAFAQSEHEVIQDGTSVHSNYIVPNSRVPEAYRDYFDASVDRVEYSVNFQWQPPSLVINRVSLKPTDASKTAIYRTGTHLMTPETATTAHYHFAHTRNFQLEDARVDARTRRWQKLGLTDQDGPIIEACQAAMGDTTDIMSLHPALFPFDEAAVRVRRILAGLIGAEQPVVAVTG
jgi:phenylpropionate dioxygenase-like ring-hydroxylating dioxygenase large terminal subunit